jgi:hypothetical protein
MPSCKEGNSGSRVIESTSTTGQFPVDVRRLSACILATGTSAAGRQVDVSPLAAEPPESQLRANGRQLVLRLPPGQALYGLRVTRPEMTGQPPEHRSEPDCWCEGDSNSSDSAPAPKCHRRPISGLPTNRIERSWPEWASRNAVVSRGCG